MLCLEPYGYMTMILIFLRCWVKSSTCFQGDNLKFFVNNRGLLLLHVPPLFPWISRAISFHLLAKRKEYVGIWGFGCVCPYGWGNAIPFPSANFRCTTEDSCTLNLNKMYLNVFFNTFKWMITGIFQESVCDFTKFLCWKIFNHCLKQAK